MYEDTTTTRVRMDPEFEKQENPHLAAARGALIFLTEIFFFPIS